MAILDIFSRIAGSRQAGKKKPAKKPVVEKKEEKIKEEKPVLQKEPRRQKKDTAVVYGIVKRPHISEKATDLGIINQYVFRVFPRANKNQVKKTIENIYGVDVLAVNMITIPSKKRRLGKTTGFKKGYKKAIVKIKQGQKIEII